MADKIVTGAPNCGKEARLIFRDLELVADEERRCEDSAMQAATSQW